MKFCDFFKKDLQQKVNLKEEFAKDSNRLEKLSLEHENIYYDFSKNLVDDEILAKLVSFAKESNLESKISAMFAGEKINTTENRAVLHTALRDLSDKPLVVDGQDIRKEVSQEKARVKALVEKVISGGWKGFSGKKI